MYKYIYKHTYVKTKRYGDDKDMIIEKNMVMGKKDMVKGKKNAATCIDAGTNKGGKTPKYITNDYTLYENIYL